VILLLEAGIKLSMTGGKCNPVKQPGLWPSANAKECAIGTPRKPLSAVMCERVNTRHGILTLTEADVEKKAIGIFMGYSVYTVRRWICRGVQTGNFRDLPRSGRPAVYSEETALKVVAFYCQTRPLPGCGRWTLRWAEAYLAAYPEKIEACPSKSTIHRILRNNSLKPHLSIYFLQITDPDFFPKMEHLLALYKDPPSNLYFFDECPGIQILKRLAPDLQTNEMKKRLEEFEYIRNGTMDVLAFLNHADGKVYAECRSNHKTSTFLDMFRRHVARAPASEPLHYVMDNLASHRGYPFCELIAELSDVECPSKKELNSLDKRVAWLQSQDKRIIIHYTPYHGSWLNMVEIWFGIMGRKVLGESFGSADALKAAFEAFVEQHWNGLLAHPFKWGYDGNGLHGKSVKRFTKLLANSAGKFEVRTLIKMLALMTNLLTDYYHEVPESTWDQLAEAAELNDKIIADLIERDDRPKRKVKAEKVLTAFRISIRQRTGHKHKAAA
jgi:transposase